MSNEKISFNEIVDKATKQYNADIMRPVIEKELLHYEVFSALYQHNLLGGLVFQGGTSLRLCHGSSRFSEDLDFAGGKAFSPEKYSCIAEVIKEYIGNKYGLNIYVKPPRERIDSSEIEDIVVSKWQVSIETRPERKDIPRQKIKLEIANVPAHTSELTLIKNNYSSIQNSDEVMVRAETLSEILADKLLAFPVCTKVIRYRDIWDVAWLLQQKNTALDIGLLKMKLDDYRVPEEAYLSDLDNRVDAIFDIVNSDAFNQQMSRFISTETLDRTLRKEGFHGYLAKTLSDILVEVRQGFDGMQQDFKM